MTIAEAAKRPTKARKSARPTVRRETFRLSRSPSHLLRRAEQFAAEIFLRSEMPQGVTLRQTVLLAAIAESEGASQADLVGATGVDRSTLAEMMARMERKGLIKRAAAAEDARAKSVRLTNEGRRRLDGAMPAMQAVDKALLAALPQSQRSAFMSTLAELANAAETHAAPAEEPAPKMRKTAAKRPAKKVRKR